MAENLQREHVERAVSRYSSLFTLPSHRNIVALISIQCVITGIVAVIPSNPSPYGLLTGLSLGVILFIATIFGDYLTANVLLRKDLILDLRRCSFLSLASNATMLVLTFVAALASTSFGDPNLWFKLASLAVFASVTLRFLVFYSVSFVSTSRIYFSVVLQPSLFLTPILTTRLSLHGLPIYSMLHLFLAGLTAFLGVYLFVAPVNAVGTKALGIPSMKMFKAFLANWTEDLEEPLEQVLEQLSDEREVRVSMIAFRTEERMKAAIVVPCVHPGPFRNIGSSSIPSAIQEGLEKRLGCIVSVPHGISGHELDLASRSQNEKVLNRVFETAEFSLYHAHATPFRSLKREGATVGCQVFGNYALLTLTLAPETMEDLPLELNDMIIQEAKKNGLAWAAAIDAHNSIQGPFNPEKAIAPMTEAVSTVLKEVSSSDQAPFDVGAAKANPRDFGPEEGMGPGGIAVVIVKVDEQITAYVTIDGNNMVSGLREKILSNLRKLGVTSGEILTTDTHVVNAVVIADRGYHPIGEKIDHDRLIEYVKTVVAEALGNLEPATASWRQEDVKGVKTIGERRIDELSSLVDEAAEKAKTTSRLVFPAVGILLIVLLMLL